MNNRFMTFHDFTKVISQNLEQNSRNHKSLELYGRHAVIIAMMTNHTYSYCTCTYYFCAQVQCYLAQEI